MRIRCRAPDGKQAVIGASLAPSSSTLADLKAEIAAATEIHQSFVQVKAGFPPKVIALPDTATLAECGVKDGDQIVVEKLAAPDPAAAVDGVRAGNEGLLHVKEMADDNSCLFHAISHVFGDTSTVAELRKEISAAVLADPATYSEAVLGRPPAAYAAWIQSPQSWGGAIELAAFAAARKTEIASVDVATGRCDRFGEGAGYSRAVALLYSGIHYDALVLRRDPGGGGGGEDVTVFEGAARDAVEEAAALLAEKWRKQKKFTDLANFTLKCSVCKQGLKGQKEAQAHAVTTGHAAFEEYS
ncbi:hypothetical protein DFJ73DRAFT_213626 [Zopfochytrium polystomum]|nr:hypothetical protein DFJ73DRAFT_213626 [Zopfochytrium polystomum]